MELSSNTFFSGSVAKQMMMPVYGHLEKEITMYENLAKMRVSERLNEGLHSQALGRNRSKKRRRNVFVAGSIVLIILIVIGLSGCQTGNVSVAAAKASDDSGVNMADRIRFQDSLLDQQAEIYSFVEDVSNLGGMSMANRIRFQDKFWDQSR